MPTHPASNNTVLVVDDEPHILEALRDLLEDSFFVLTASSAQEGLRLLKTRPVAVLVSDQRMPDVTGDAFLRQARKISQATRVLITGYADIQALKRAVNYGQIYSYVTKPWDPEALHITITAAADHYKVLQALHVERQRNRQILDTALDAVITINAEGRIISWNPRAEVMFGWSFDQVEGLLLSNTIVPTQHRQAHRLGLAHFLATGEGPILNRLVEMTALNKEGIEFPVELTVSTIQIDGQPEFSAFIRDISQRKNIESVERRHRETLEQMLTHLPAGVCLLDRTTRLVAANPAAQTWLPDLAGTAAVGADISRLGLHTFNEILDQSQIGTPVKIVLEGPPKAIYEVVVKTIEDDGYILVMHKLTPEG